MAWQIEFDDAFKKDLAKLGDFWKYRVGDHQISSSIKDGALQILVAKIGNRKEDYRQ